MIGNPENVPLNFFHSYNKAETYVQGFLHFTDDTAGNFPSRITGGLRSKIIRCIVNNYCSSDYFLKTKSICQDFHVGFPVAAQQWRQIPSMIRVLYPARIKMPAGIWKGIPSAIAAFVDMECEKTAFRIGKAKYACFHNHAIRSLIKTHITQQLRIFNSTINSGNRFLMDSVIHLFTPSLWYDSEYNIVNRYAYKEKNRQTSFKACRITKCMHKALQTIKQTRRIGLFTIVPSLI